MENHPPVQLFEEEITALFERPVRRRRFAHKFWGLVKTVLSLVVTFAIAFVLVNFPAFRDKISFLTRSKSIIAQVDTLSQPIVVAKIQKDDAQEKQLREQLIAQVAENHLVIPAINLNAPTLWNIAYDQIIPQLENGVVHYAGTALPGEIGNTFIVGHSSNYWWDKGQYNQVFALLDNLKNNDKIYLNYKNQVYIYQISNKKVVKPTELAVLDPTDHSIVTLMTCYPIGTAFNRLIIQADEIYPTQSQKTQSKPILTPNLLPAIR